MPGEEGNGGSRAGADPAQSSGGTAPADVCLTQRVLQLVPEPRASAGKEGCRDFWENNCPPSHLSPLAPGGYLQLRGLVYDITFWSGCRSRLLLPLGRRAGSFVDACVT